MPDYKSLVFTFLLLLFNCSNNAFTQTTENEELQTLQSFALEVLNSSHRLKAVSKDSEAAKLEMQRSRLNFNPEVSVTHFSSKASDKTFNPLTGLEEDYSTDRQGVNINLSQPTQIGNAQVNIEKSNTDFGSGSRIYFESLDLILESGLIRRDANINRLERKMASSRYNIEKAREDSAILDTLMQSFEALFSRLIALRNLQFRTRNIKFYQTMLDEAQIKLENGLGSKLDLRQAQMRLTLAKTALHESELSFKEADRQIDLLLGDPDWDRKHGDFSAGNLPVNQSYDINELLSSALKNRPDMKIINTQLQLQDQNFSLAHERSRPNLVARFVNRRQGRSADSSIAANKGDKSWNLAVTWSTKIGHRPERLTKRIEEKRLSALNERLIAAIDRTETEVINAIKRFKFNQSNLTALKNSALLSQEVLEGQQINFQSGSISLLDLSRYQTEFEEAEMSALRAEAVLALSWIHLLYVSGELRNVFVPEYETET